MNNGASPRRGQHRDQLFDRLRIERDILRMERAFAKRGEPTPAPPAGSLRSIAQNVLNRADISKLAPHVIADRLGGRLISALAAVFVLALVSTALLALQYQAERQSAERQTLVRRADELAAQALAPNSPLACLDAPAGLPVESACEALLFGRPETIAAAVSYIAAKLALLSEAASFASVSAVRRNATLAMLRRDVEADRFGIVAHVLAVTSACDADHCDAFALVGNAERIKSNLREGTFDQFVARHTTAWPSGKREPAMSDAASLKGAVTSTASRPLVAKPLSPGQDLPSAASIPPVSIMTPEGNPR